MFPLLQVTAPVLLLPHPVVLDHEVLNEECGESRCVTIPHGSNLSDIWDSDLEVRTVYTCEDGMRLDPSMSQQSQAQQSSCSCRSSHISEHYSNRFAFLRNYASLFYLKY